MDKVDEMEIMLLLSRTHGFHMEDVIGFVKRNKSEFNLDDEDNLEDEVKETVIKLVLEGKINVNNACLHTNTKHKNLGFQLHKN